MTFTPGLPDQDCCTITLSGDVSDSWKVRTLQGDTSRDGNVTTSDAATIKPKFQAAVNATTFQYDYSADGVITASDAALIKSLFQNQAPACP